MKRYKYMMYCNVKGLVSGAFVDRLVRVVIPFVHILGYCSVRVELHSQLIPRKIEGRIL